MIYSNSEIDPQTNRNLFTETSTKPDQERNITLKLPNYQGVAPSRIIFHAKGLLLASISSASTLFLFNSAVFSTPAQALLPGAPPAPPHPVPWASLCHLLLSFFQLGSHCSWSQAAERPRLQPALEALVSPPNCLTLLLGKPPDCLLLQHMLVWGCSSILLVQTPNNLTGAPVQISETVLHSVSSSWWASGTFCPGRFPSKTAAWLPKHWKVC